MWLWELGNTTHLNYWLTDYFGALMFNFYPVVFDYMDYIIFATNNDIYFNLKSSYYIFNVLFLLWFFFLFALCAFHLILFFFILLFISLDVYFSYTRICFDTGKHTGLTAVVCKCAIWIAVTLLEKDGGGKMGRRGGNTEENRLKRTSVERQKNKWRQEKRKAK